MEANPQFNKRYSRFRSCKLVNACLSNAVENVSFAIQVKDFSTKSGIASSNKNGKLHDELRLTCTTASNVFREAAIRHVDWLDLDAEGHELQILKGVDFTDVEIDIITVEANNRGVDEFLESLGYRKFGIFHYDEIFVRPGFEFMDQITAAVDDCL